MRTHATVTCLLLLTACGPKASFHDYSTPERAARSFVEAGRVGDTSSLRRAVCAAERDGDVTCDYREIGDYSLTLERLIDDEKAVVMLHVGPISSPLACLREEDGWTISLRGSLQLMQQMLQDQLATAPR